MILCCRQARMRYDDEEGLVVVVMVIHVSSVSVVNIKIISLTLLLIGSQLQY